MRLDGALVTAVTTSTLITTAPPSVEMLSAYLADNFVFYLNKLDKVPGGSILLRYIKSSYQDDPIRSLFELALLIVAIKYFLSSKKKENKSEIVRFSNAEIDELCKEWDPLPLVTPVLNEEKWDIKAIPEITGSNGYHIEINNHKVLNFASFDFLNFHENIAVRQAAKEVIAQSGVGACGPPNFYGTQDVHVKLESDLAEFFGTEGAIIYGQDFPTAGSVIAAFLKRGDLCVVDNGVNIAIQNALVVSRCDVEWYDHNDMDHLQQVLEELKPMLDKTKPIRRRFIITEGLFANTSDLAVLPRIVELKNKFKYRLLLDESLSAGVVGRTGRGLPEHYDIARNEISITIGSFATTFASSGGFCVGVGPMVEHQRIQSLAYVYSAALPPYSSRVVSKVLEEISTLVDNRGHSQLVSSLQEKSELAYDLLAALIPDYFTITSQRLLPMIQLQLLPAVRRKLLLPKKYGKDTFLTTGKPPKTGSAFDKTFNLESFLLQRIIDRVLHNGNILITRSKLILEREHLPLPPPQLRIMISRSSSVEDLHSLAQHVALAIASTCSDLSTNADLLNLEEELVNY